MLKLKILFKDKNLKNNFKNNLALFLILV